MLLNMLVLAADNPVDHVANHPVPWMVVNGWWTWSGHTGNLLLSGLVLLIVGPLVAKSIGTKNSESGADKYVTKGRFAQMIEVICVYLRETTVRPLLGKRTDTFMPFLWTLFFFILVNNIIGLIPLLDLQHTLSPTLKENHAAYFGGTATQSVYVTAVLAIVTFLVVNIAGIRELGLVGYLKHLTGGAPAFIWPIMIPVEILGTFVKPFALAIRLFANMTAGHVLMATLFMFAGLGAVNFASGGVGLIIGGSVTLISAVAAVAIYFLELFVAFLQAFVFMFLTAVFISQLAHHDHGHDSAHDHDHAHDGGHGHHGHEHAHA